MLLTLYGINNIGKSTQAKRLVEALQARGYNAVYVKYPVYELEPTGPKLNQVLRGGGAQAISEEELQLWFTLNRYQFEPTLRQWLAEGKIVVAEDYIGTGIAWGTVKGASTDWLETVNKGLIKEDLALLMDGERFLEGKEAGHAHEDNPEFMARSRQVHLDLAKRYGWTLVSANGGVEEVAERLWKAVELHLPQK